MGFCDDCPNCKELYDVTRNNGICPNCRHVDVDQAYHEFINQTVEQINSTIAQSLDDMVEHIHDGEARLKMRQELEVIFYRDYEVYLEPESESSTKLNVKIRKKIKPTSS
jgi:RNA polymerase subunit RPABC4/transcription elongation factor Spt4